MTSRHGSEFTQPGADPFDIPLQKKSRIDPSFPPDVLDYRIDKAGFLAAFPYLLMALIVQSAGVLADYARTKGRLTTTQVQDLYSWTSIWATKADVVQLLPA